METERAESLVALLCRDDPTLSSSQRKIAAFVLSHPFQAATLGIEDLAEAAGASTATVHRFVRKLGFDGYADFRSEALRMFGRALAPVEKLRDQQGRSDAALPVMTASLRSAAESLVRARQVLDDHTCEQAVSLIMEAQRVTVLGLGISSALARFVAELIGPFCHSLDVLDGLGGIERMMRRTMRMTSGDLLIALTLPRYSRTTIDLVRAARERGASVMGLTDAPDAPIVPSCDTVLFADAQHDVLHASSVGLAATAEALAAVLTLRCQTTEDATELTERILPYLFVEDELRRMPNESRDETLMTDGR